MIRVLRAILLPIGYTVHQRDHRRFGDARGGGAAILTRSLPLNWYFFDD
jgi:hypothetical protein